jgi:hypothetical protein
MNESTQQELVSALPHVSSIETAPEEKKSAVLRGIDMYNRTKVYVAATVMGVASIVAPVPAKAMSPENTVAAGIAVVALGVGIANALEGNKRSGDILVTMSDKTRTDFERAGFRIGPNDQFIDNMKGQKIHFKYLCNGSKSAFVETLSRNQLLIRYVYQKQDGEYKQSVIYDITEVREGNKTAGLKSYTQEERNR